MRDYDELVSCLRIEADGLLVDDKPDMLLYDSLREAADAIEELQKALDVVNDAHNEGYDVGYWAGRRDYKPKWISVEDRLPDVNERVLACVSVFGEPSVWDAVRWNGKEWEAEKEAAYEYWTSIDFPVTHWMPLPEPPKEEKECI